MFWRGRMCVFDFEVLRLLYVCDTYEESALNLRDCSRHVLNTPVIAYAVVATAGD